MTRHRARDEFFAGLSRFRASRRSCGALIAGDDLTGEVREMRRENAASQFGVRRSRGGPGNAGHHDRRATPIPSIFTSLAPFALSGFGTGAHPGQSPHMAVGRARRFTRRQTRNPTAPSTINPTARF